jgi:predicted HAD superfamily Cof-like phosphohydrolase
MYRELVLEFNQKIGTVVNPGPTIVDERCKLLRMRLIAEELGETVVAMHEDNEELIADGICDLLYVIAGTAVSYGTELTEPNPNWRPFWAGDLFQFKTDRVSIMAQAMADLFHAMDRGDLSMLRFAVSALFNEVYLTGLGFGLPISALFQEVHRSNMTKDVMNKHGKGGKGDVWQPPRLKEIIAEHKVKA